MHSAEMTTGRLTPASPRPPRLTTCLARNAAWPASIALAALLSGCGSSKAAPTAAVRTGDRSHAAAASRPAPSLVRVPRPDYARPGSVAASFFTAWASVDAVHEGPQAYLARCADLVTAALRRQFAASQPALAGWQALRAERLVSLVHVRAVTRPAGAPPPGAARIYLRVYAQQVTTTTAGRTITSDGITLQLTRRGRRWLVSRLLWY